MTLGVRVKGYTIDSDTQIHKHQKKKISKNDIMQSIFYVPTLNCRVNSQYIRNV